MTYLRSLYTEEEMQMEEQKDVLVAVDAVAEALNGFPPEVRTRIVGMASRLIEPQTKWAVIAQPVTGVPPGNYDARITDVQVIGRGKKRRLVTKAKLQPSAKTARGATWITAKEAAELIGVPTYVLYTAKARGLVRTDTKDNTVTFDRKSVLDYSSRRKSRKTARK